MRLSITRLRSIFILLSAVFSCNALSISSLPEISGSNTVSGDRFGSAVSISGNDVIVGAPLQDTDGIKKSGAAYIFTGGAETKLTAGIPTDYDHFGSSVAIHDDTALVGSIYADQKKVEFEPLLNGDGTPLVDEDDNPLFELVTKIDVADSGAVYVFRRSEGEWFREGYLTTTEVKQGDWLGYSVAGADNHIVAGSPLRDRDASTLDSGAVYVYTRYTNLWIDEEADSLDDGVQLHTLQPADLKAGDWFGSAVAISNNTIVAGANGSDIDGPSSGAVYVFTRNQDGSWQQQARLRPSDPASYQFFGHTVAISGNTIIVGAYLASSNKGAAYVFNRLVDGKWAEQAILTDTSSSVGDHFASSVAVSGSLAAIGAYRESTRTGSAQLFYRDVNDNWLASTAITSVSAATYDDFSFSVALSGYSAVIGIPEINSQDTGRFQLITNLDTEIDTDGDGTDNSADLDDDLDGVFDVNDMFPTNINEYSDIDGDGFGDNADAFIYQTTESFDSDNDGVGNNQDTDDDNDGAFDIDEIVAGTDPLDATDIPSSQTTDTSGEVTDDATTDVVASSGSSGSIGPGMLFIFLLVFISRRLRLAE